MSPLVCNSFSFHYTSSVYHLYIPFYVFDIIDVIVLGNILKFHLHYVSAIVQVCKYCTLTLYNLFTQ